MLVKMLWKYLWIQFMVFLVLVPSNYVMNGSPLLVLLSLENLHISPANLLNNYQLVMLYLGIQIVAGLCSQNNQLWIYTNNQTTLITLWIKNYNKVLEQSTLSNLYLKARISKRKLTIQRQRRLMPELNVM